MHCAFFQDEIEYLGYTLTKEGLKKTKEKVKAIVAAAQPRNLSEVRSFIGLVNYYNKFIPEAASILSPIYDLLKANTTFLWSRKCQDAFVRIKETIASDDCIVHFDPNLPIIVTADASDNGIAGMLSHVIDGEERTVACVSRTLQPSERNMSTIMKEALAIYFTVNKLYYYLCNTHFTLRSDHKPLLAIFGEHRDIPKMSANKLMRWAIFLSSFNYRIEHIKGLKNNVVADYMSRAPIPTTVTSEEAAGRATYIHFTESVKEWPINNEEIRKASRQDSEIAEIMSYVSRNKWPERVSENLKPYRCRMSELHIDHEILMWGHRVVVPKALRSILNLIHSDHSGIARCKALARSIVFWIGIDGELEGMVNGCITCLKTR